MKHASAPFPLLCLSVYAFLTVFGMSQARVLFGIQQKKVSWTQHTMTALNIHCSEFAGQNSPGVPINNSFKVHCTWHMQSNREISSFTAWFHWQKLTKNRNRIHLRSEHGRIFVIISKYQQKMHNIGRYKQSNL